MIVDDLADRVLSHLPTEGHRPFGRQQMVRHRLARASSSSIGFGWRVLWLATIVTSGIRFGEATNPGPPQVTILSCNVTSLEAHWADLVDPPWDCLLVQEARISPESWVWKDCQRRGWAGHPGPAGPNGQSLVAAVTKAGAIHMRAPLAAGPPERSMQFLWHAGGPCPWTITNCYTPADGSQAARLLASAMIREAAAEAEAHWTRPCLVAGDFQWSLQELPIHSSRTRGEQLGGHWRPTANLRPGSGSPQNRPSAGKPSHASTLAKAHIAVGSGDPHPCCTKH